MRADLDRRPLLVFWETTRACLLACRHCRASAMPEPLPGELSTEQAERFVDSLAGFGPTPPVLVLTGGDVMMRHDLVPLVRRARGLGVPVAISPSVTPLLTRARLRELREAGVKAASISLDGATAATHEGLRRVDGHFEATLDAVRMLRTEGFVVQLNTVVMRENVDELADVAAIVHGLGAAIWEVFFLVRVGRGTVMHDLEPEPAENEQVCHFLYDASRHGFVVRTVEAPFFRRVVAERRAGGQPQDGPLYRSLSGRLRALLGEGEGASKAQTKGTRDGKGIVFVAHNGDVHPAGFLPVRLGNVVHDDLATIYRTHPLLSAIRAGRFTGRCGPCEFADLCGGSRARAFATSGDPLGEDPACPFASIA